MFNTNKKAFMELTFYIKFILTFYEQNHFLSFSYEILKYVIGKKMTAKIINILFLCSVQLHV